MSATEVGTAYVTLLPSMRGFSKAAEGEIGRSGIGAAISRVATRGASSAGTQAGGFFSRAFSKETLKQSTGGGLYVAGLLRNLRTYGYALSGITGLTVGLGLKTASSLEQARIAFTTILGSASKAKVLYSSLIQFAKVTPFNVPGIIQASQQLLAYGFQAKQVLPVLHSLGDASAGLSLGTDGLQRVVVALGQIQAKGRLQAQELLQLTDNGIPALAILANKFGITQAALLKFVSKGLVPANKAIPALLSGLETGTKGLAGQTAKFGGLMQKQSHTLGGIFSNLQDTISIGLARAVQPLVPVLKNALPKAMNALSHAFKVGSRDLAEFLHGLGVAKDKSKGTTTGFETLGTVVRGAFSGLRSVLGFVGRHASVFKTLGVLVLGAIAALKVFRVVMIGVDAVLNANPISLIVLAIGAFIAALVLAYKKSETFRDIVKAVFHVLEVVAGHWVAYNIDAFKFVFDAMTSFVGGALHLAAAAFGWVPGVGPKLKEASRAFDGFRSDVDGVLSGIANDAIGLGGTAGSNWVTAFNDAAAGFGVGKKSPFRDPGHPGYLGSTTNDAKKKGNAVGYSYGSGIGGGLSGGLSKAAHKVGKSATSLVTSILGPLKAMVKQAAQYASQITQAITGDTGFGALLNRTDSLGAAFGLSLSSILSGLKAQKLSAVRFRRELLKLEHRGLSTDAAAEIAGEGLVNGGKVADALLGASKSQLKQVSRDIAQTNKTARQIGNDLAGQKYGPQLVRELAATHRAVEKAAKSTTLSSKTIHQLEKAYKAAAKSVQPYVKTTELDHKHGKKVRQHG